MKVALIDTMDKAQAGRVPNLAIASLAGYLLQHGYEVGVLDLFFADAETQAAFFSQKWDLIGITATSFSFSICLDTARTLKHDFKISAPIVVGGAHASVGRETILDDPAIDFGIYGEGEIPLVALARCVEQTDSPSPDHLASIKGLLWRDGDHVRINPPEDRIRDLDALPLPPYELFPMDQYVYHAISTSRGCPFACVYCASAAIMGKNWITRSPERIVEEIEYVITRWGKRPFNVVDDSFNLNEDRVRRLCELMIERKLDIEWSACGIRADKTAPDMLRLMRESGCTSVCVGIESGNATVLKNIGKGETKEQIADGIYRLKEAGIRVVGMFMIGNPGDTKRTVQESIRFAKSLPLNRVRFYLARPYPSTGLWDFVCQHGRMLSANYMDLHDHTGTPVFETDDFSYRDRIRCYRAARRLMFPDEPVINWEPLMGRVERLRKRFRRDGVWETAKFLCQKAAGKRPVVPLDKTAEEDAPPRIHTRFSRQ